MKRIFSFLFLFSMVLSMLLPAAPLAQAAASPASSASTEATLAYTLKNLPIGVAVQNYYIGEQYIYTTQRSTNSTYLSRLKINGNTASYVDHMVLTNWGHGETLDFYRYNGKEYFLVGSKASAATTSYWSTQIARIQYEPGRTYNDYTSVTRFTTLNRCNSTGANDASTYGDVLRAAAAVCGNYTIFRIQFTDKTVRYSIYDTNKLNAALDSTTTSVYLEMKSTAACNALVNTFIQSGSNYVHPNGSFQGIELSSKSSIYLSGGGMGDTPQIAMMNNSGSYKKLISITNVGSFEIEGMQAERGRLYFLIMPDPNNDGTITSAEKKVSQVIYYINESIFGINHTLSETAGTAPTCTTAGISAAVTCTTCGFPQEVQETLPALGHTVVTIAGQEPTATSAGWSESSYCSVCNAVLTERQELSALGYAKGDSEPLRIVIDYGRDVELSIEEIQSGLFYNPNDVSASFLGIVTNATHGRIATEAPSALYLENVGDTLELQNVGIYERFADSIRFTPDGIMNETARVYAIFRMTETYAASSATWYLPVSIEIIPANIMYYEAEDLVQSGDLTFEQKTDDTLSDDSTIITDTDDRLIPVNTYIPTNDKNVLFFSFNNTTEDQTRYNNAIYGEVNHDLLSKWSVFGGVDQYSYLGEIHNPAGALNLHLCNPTGTWIQLRTAFSLQYQPCYDAWIEVRMRLNDVKANNGSTISFCPEFFANTNNTSLRTRPSTTITLSEVGQNWFVLKFPFVTSNAWPNAYSFTDAALIRGMSMTFEGLLPNYGHSISIDYFYVGPEETCPSSLNADRLYFSFDGTPADEYRYYNQIYGKRNDFDKTPAYGDDWYFTKERTPSIAVTGGAMNIVAGVKGGIGTDSPYVQTLQELDYSAERAEVAQVRLKLSGMTTDVVEDMFTDIPSVRIGFTLDDDADYETSACWFDWSVTEEQLNGCDYMTLKADISDLLAAHEAKKIRAVRLTIANASGISEGMGTVTVDYIYIGPKETQDTDIYITEPSIAPEQDPPTDTYSPLYDERALFFGFEDVDNDAGYFQYNKNYGGRNFSNSANWWAPSYGSITGVSGGALVFYSKNTGATWGYAASGKGTTTNSAETEFPLQYTPSASDWCEVRLKIDGAVADSNSRLNFILELFPNSGDSTARVRSGDYISASKIGTGYFVIRFPMVGSTLSGSLETSYTYTTLPIIRRINFLIANVKKGTAFTTYIDYCYIGPQELMPSKMDQSYLYFGFENNEAAQYKYTSAVYGANYDSGGHWDYHKDRSSAPSTANGMMTAAVTAKGAPWFETKRGGYATGNNAMNYCPNTAPSDPEEIQVRVRFNNVQVASSSATINFFFFDASDHRDATARNIGIPITAADVTTNGKWFTYRIKLGSTLSGLNKADSFRIAFTNVVSSSGTGTIDIDYIYVGPSLYVEPADLSADRCVQNKAYGYDSLYTKDGMYSDHRAIFANGKGVAQLTYLTGDDGEYLLDDENNKILAINYASTTQYTDASFTFMGTGFDIISRTGKDQGALRVVICDASGVVKKTVTVINKGETELYQIPVVSVNDLAYGTYTVHVFVNAPYENANYPDLCRGGEFYFDAIRIYNPIDTDATDTDSAYANSIYQVHGEANPTFLGLRNLLLDEETFDPENALNGVLYLDCSINSNDPMLTKYTAVGPKNEVYLGKGNTVAFKLVVEGDLPTSVDIGAKSVNGTAVTLCSSVSTSAPSEAPTGNAENIASCTAMYYPLAVSQWETDEEGNHFVYVAIQNTGNGILSLTNVKFGYAASKTGKSRSVALRIDDSMLEAFGLTESEEKAPVKEEALDFTMSISAGAEMTVTYNIMGADVNSYSDFYLEVKKDVAGGDPITTVYGITEDREQMTSKVNPATGEALMYQVTYKGINAKEMGDNFSTTLYAVGEDGTIYYGTTVVDSIKSYLVGKIDADASIPELKTMAVDMLKYGAAAQVRLGYNTENLVTADLTEEQLSYATTEIPEAVNNAASSGTGAAVNTNITVTSRVQLNLSCICTTATDPNAVKCVITDSEGKVLAEIAAANKGNIMFSAIYENVGAKEMRDVINATFYEGETAISQTISWSVESYVAQVRAKTNVAEDELNMVNAMLTYGDSVAAYMEAK